MTDTHDTTDGSTFDPEELSPGAREMLSRRGFMQASAAATAGAAGLGTVGSAAAQTVIDESCDGEFEEFPVGEGDSWSLMNNTWGMPGAHQCIWVADDGSYGYEFNTDNVNCNPGDPEQHCINYPEVYCGGRPWGSDSGIPELPARRGDVDELTLEWDVDIDIPQGEWDLAEEWWLIDGEPHGDQETLYEIMLVLDWGGGHGHYMEQPAVIEDQYGNTIDHWADYSEEGGGAGANFHIFRISEGTSSGRVDLTEIIDYMTQNYGVSEDLTLTGIEVGNEYWLGAEGEVTYNAMNLDVNGARYESGPGTGPEPPTSPDDQWTNEVTATEIEMAWSSVGEAEHYNVYLDGDEVDSTSSTTYTFDGLEPNTQYDVGVQSENSDGTSSREEMTVRTDEEEQAGPCADVESMEVDGQRVCNVDGDAYYRDVNGDGSVGNRDVGAFFENFHFDAFDRDEFDYSGNGRVSHGDVVALFDYVV